MRISRRDNTQSIRRFFKQDEVEVNFVVDESFNVVIGTKHHGIIANEEGIDSSKALVPTGAFKKTTSGGIRFEYWLNGSKIDKKVLEEKIRKFLRQIKILE